MPVCNYINHLMPNARSFLYKSGNKKKQTLCNLLVNSCLWRLTAAEYGMILFPFGNKTPVPGTKNGCFSQQITTNYNKYGVAHTSLPPSHICVHVTFDTQTTVVLTKFAH